MLVPHRDIRIFEHIQEPDTGCVQSKPSVAMDRNVLDGPVDRNTDACLIRATPMMGPWSADM